MTAPIATLRDDFANNTVDPAWGNSSNTGFGAYSETGGQAVLTLPSSTAGSHLAAYTTAGTYDLTGDQFVWNIATMVATGVAATAYFQLLVDASGNNQLYWRQLSNAITARTIVAGVDTQLFTATWSAATYKYLRIREASGTIFFDSSTNGTSWTNRASVANPFAVTSLIVQFAASCGNVASPGSLKLDDVNLILPAVATNWRWTQVEWPLFYRFRPITLAIDTAGTVQGYIAVASSIDSSGNLVSPIYYSGPMGSASGGYNALTLVGSQAAAQAMAVNLPLDGRWDLPSIIEARFIRLYHRSIDASAHTLREYYPRRIVQADDIEAESIRAINIAAGAITADKIFVLALSDIVGSIGQLTLTNPTGAAAWLYQGTGTGDAPTTGLKIYNSAGFGKISFYNAASAILDISQNGLTIHAVAGADVISTPNALTWLDASSNQIAAVYTSYDGAGSKNWIGIRAQYAGARKGIVEMYAEDASGVETGLTLDADSTNTLAGISLISLNNRVRLFAGVRNVRVDGQGLYIGTAFIDPTVGVGQLSTDNGVGFGVAAQSNIRMIAKGQDATSSNYSLFAQDSAGATRFYVRNDGAGFLGTTAWTYSSDASKKKNIRALGKDVREFLLLEPRAFDYIDGAANRWGYIAQEVQAILPDLIETQEDGGLGMRTDELLPLFNHVLRRLIRILLQKGVIGPADIV